MKLKKLISTSVLFAMAVSGSGFQVFAEETEEPAENGAYVLMDIPYAKFYEAELGENDPAVDAVTSATKNKPRTGTLAGGSYHVSSEGTDISGVIYPVYVEDLAWIKDETEITDESSVSITVTNRGQTTTTVYEGKDALFESADYSYYVLDEEPAYYKTMTIEEGEYQFSAITGASRTVEGVEAEVKVGARHADVEIALSNTEGIEKGDPVSGVILTMDDGSKYALRHIANIWRATEIGWNADEFSLDGRKITNIRYLTQNSIIDYPVEISLSAYVLMDIPYAKFYEAELGENDPAVDAVTSATKNKPRTGTLAGGSYHVSSEGTDISGVIYPVYVDDLTWIKDETKITDESSVTIIVTNRGQETTTVYEGKDALFESADYSYYVLSEQPSLYKTLIKKDGEYSFSEINAEPATKEGVEAEVTIGARHADIEISLNNTEGIETGDRVSAVILSMDDGSKYGLRHIANIWRATEIGWNVADFALNGRTITNVRYITEDAVIDYPVEIKADAVLPEGIQLNQTEMNMAVGETAELEVTVTPEDAMKKITVRSSDPETVSIDRSGKLTAVKPGNATVTVTTSNGLSAECKVRVLFSDVKDDHSYYYEPVYWAVDEKITVGYGAADLFSPGYSVTRGQFVTFLYRLAGEPEVTEDSGFDDVDPAKFYAKSIAWAAANGITTGYAGRNEFGPDDKCTREQIVTFLWRYAESPKPEKTVSFTDSRADAYYLDALSWAAEKEITVGLNDGTGRFGVGMNCTRGMTVTFLYRFDQNK